MKNYYEILEINKNASQDVIDKVYKVLVKKYHPDLQTNPIQKARCESKIKEINEAYEVLSNVEKREEYNNELAKIEQQNNQPVYQPQQTQRPQQQPQHPPQKTQQQVQNEQLRQQQQIREEQIRQQQAFQNAINQAYRDAYIQDMKNRGYRFKRKKTFSDYLRSLIAILITIGIIILVCQLPFVRDYFNSLYNNNVFIHNLVDTFK